MSHSTLPLQPHGNNWIGGDSLAHESSSSQTVRWQNVTPFQPLNGLEGKFQAFHSAQSECKELHNKQCPSGEGDAEAKRAPRLGWLQVALNVLHTGSRCLSTLLAVGCALKQGCPAPLGRCPRHSLGIFSCGPCLFMPGLGWTLDSF